MADCQARSKERPSQSMELLHFHRRKEKDAWTTSQHWRNGYGEPGRVWASRHGHDHCCAASVHHGQWNAAGNEWLDLHDDQLGVGVSLSIGYRAAGKHGSERERKSTRSPWRQHPQPAGNPDDTWTTSGSIYH
jgi:hypothetical protein